MSRLSIFLVLILCGSAASAYAQFPPRLDDHFWRKKVVYLLDLDEKLNEPLIKPEGNTYNRNSQSLDKYPNKDGMVVALLQAMERSELQGYDPQNLDKPITGSEVIATLDRYNGNNEAPPVLLEGDEGVEEDEFEGFDVEEGEEEPAEEVVENNAETATEGGDGVPNAAARYKGTSKYISVIEDWIFEKNKSDINHDIQYITIHWVSPDEPMQRLVSFRYKDAMAILDKTMYKNRFNDAEYRSVQEVFELRRFRAFFTNVSGERMDGERLAETRRTQMVEFEHNLWEF